MNLLQGFVLPSYQDLKCGVELGGVIQEALARESSLSSYRQILAGRKSLAVWFIFWFMRPALSSYQVPNTHCGFQQNWWLRISVSTPPFKFKDLKWVKNCVDHITDRQVPTALLASLFVHCKLSSGYGSILCTANHRNVVLSSVHKERIWQSAYSPAPEFVLLGPGNQLDLPLLPEAILWYSTEF